MRSQKSCFFPSPDPVCQEMHRKAVSIEKHTTEADLWQTLATVFLLVLLNYETIYAHLWWHMPKVSSNGRSRPINTVKVFLTPGKVPWLMLV